MQKNLQIFTALVSLPHTTHNTPQIGPSLPQGEGHAAGHHALPDYEVKTVVKLRFCQQDT